MRRSEYMQAIEQALQFNRVVALLGPRQCGKTTLAQEYFAAHQATPEHYFDLEDPLDLQRLQEPQLALGALEGVVVIDEIQRLPNLFTVLRVLCDQKEKNRKFLILGSASRELIRQTSESLAGRIEYIELTPFSFNETHELEKLWVRGGFPLSYLAGDDEQSVRWRKNYIRTFLEQDIPNLGLNLPAQNLRRFWSMLAHYHGQLFNASELGNALDLSHVTIRKYLDVLVGTFMVRELQPWYENFGKRQVKSPKIYFRDSGIYHTLLNINSKRELQLNPILGASWEGFALESLIRHYQAEPGEIFFWATHSDAELDLMLVRGDRRLGFEFKHTNAPKLKRSMKIALEDLKLDSLKVIYPGNKRYPLSECVECIPLKEALEEKPWS